MIQKMADYLGVSPKAVIIGIVGFIIAAIIVYIKISIDEKKGVNSQEKEDIRKIISNLIPDGQQYTAAYAHSKEVYGGARMQREVYHYYAVGFRPDQTDHMWIVPIGVEGGKIVYTQPVKASAENLTHVSGNEYMLAMNFPDKKAKYIISVDGSNTKMGKECQVNIQQQEEAKAFYSFAKAFQENVNAALGVDQKGRKPKK